MLFLSRKAVLEKNNSAVKVELLKNLEEGQIVRGVVKNILITVLS